MASLHSSSRGQSEDSSRTGGTPRSPSASRPRSNCITPLLPITNSSSSSSSSSSSDSSSSSSSTVLCLAAGVVFTGSINEISGRIRSVPLGRFDAFVSLANSTVHLCLYALLLGVFSARGLIPKENVSFLRRPFSVCLLFLVGLLDSAGTTMGFIAQPYVPGPIYSLLTQTIVPFSCLFSMLLLRRRYSLLHFAALSLTFSGFLVAWSAITQPPAAAAADAADAADAAANAAAEVAGLAAAAGAADAAAAQQQPLLTAVPIPTEFPGVYEHLSSSISISSSSGSSGNSSSSSSSSGIGSGSSIALMAALVAFSTAPTALSFALKEVLVRSYEKQQQQQQRIGNDNDNSRLLPLLLPEWQQQQDNGEQQQLQQGRQDSNNNNSSSSSSSTSAAAADSSRLHVLLVCSSSTLATLLWCVAVTPLNAYLIKANEESIGHYLLDALNCFRGFGEGCAPAAPAYAAYAIANLSFNLFIMALVLEASSLLSFLAMKAIFPVSLLLYASGHWPLLPEADSTFTGPIVISLLLVLSGIIAFHFETLRCTRTYNGQNPPCCWPLHSQCLQ